MRACVCVRARVRVLKTARKEPVKQRRRKKERESELNPRERAPMQWVYQEQAAPPHTHPTHTYTQSGCTRNKLSPRSPCTTSSSSLPPQFPSFRRRRRRRHSFRGPSGPRSSSLHAGHTNRLTTGNCRLCRKDNHHSHHCGLRLPFASHRARMWRQGACMLTATERHPATSDRVCLVAGKADVSLNETLKHHAAAHRGQRLLCIALALHSTCSMIK